MAVWTLALDTVREAWRRGILGGLLGLSAAVLLFLVFLLRIDVVEGTLATGELLGVSGFARRMDLGKLMRIAYSAIAGFLCSFGMLVSVVAAAGLLPAALQPGRADLLLAQPVARWQVLLGRMAGALLAVALNVAVLAGGAWLALGAKTGVWDERFLAVIPATLFLFAVLEGVLALVAAASGSATLAALVSMGLLVASMILAQVQLAERLLAYEWSRRVWRLLYHVCPKVWDLVRSVVNHIQGESGPGWEPYWTSGALGLACLAAAIWIYERRDF